MNRGLSLYAFAFTLAFTCTSNAAVPLDEPASPPVAPIDICGTLQAAKPGPPPAILPADRPIRAIAFGDFGDGGCDQRKVASAMAEYDWTKPFDFGLTLGDNFYGNGLNSPTHPRWRTDWEIPYGPLGIRIYASLGNHDYYDQASPAAEIQRSQLSKSWCLPAPYYTFTAGPVQFFALDTDPIHQGKQSSKAQLDWLKTALAASEAQWKVVYGHHPAYSTGSEHGTETVPIRNALLPLLGDRVDVFLAGHDHDMEYLKPAKGVQFFVSGAGGHDLRVMGSDPEGRSLWAVGKTGGFTVLNADSSSLTVSFIDTQQMELCTVKLVKGQAAEVIKGCKKKG
jgi:tartrate-resistant acid phosphatase type 5